MPPTRGRGRGIRGKPSSRGRQPTKSNVKSDLPVSAEDESTEVETKITTEGESVTAMEEEPVDSEKSSVAATKTDAKAVAASDDLGDEGSKMELEGTAEVVNEEITDEADACQTDGGNTEPDRTETELDETKHITATDLVKKEATTSEQTEGSAAEPSNAGSAIVISDDNEPKEKEKEKKLGGSTTSAPVWQVRVYPVPFEEFCNMDIHFRKMLRTSLSLEFRMSRVLTMKHFCATPQKKTPAPWLPSNISQMEVASVGLVEMRVQDSALVDLVQSTRSTKFSKTICMRFELKQLSKEEALHSSQRKDMEGLGSSIVEWKMDEDTSAKKGLTVKFAVQDASVGIQGTATQQSESEEKEGAKEDNCVFVRNIPDDVPDNALQAIFLTKMVERTKGENSTGSATFDAGSPMGAQMCMEQFDGILVNNEPLELTTKQEMLRDVGIKIETSELEEVELQRLLAIQTETIETCKAEILNALPKTAIPDMPASDTATETGSAEKTKSENTPEEANTAEETKIKESSEKEICFPQSLKVKKVTETVNKFLSDKLSPPFNTPIYFPKEIFPDLAAFCPRQYEPFCESFFTDHAKLEPSTSVVPNENSGVMLMTTAFQLEALAREQIAVSSFQELATCALTEILSKSEMTDEDLAAMRSIVNGIHQSSLVLGASALVSVANLRLDKRDDYLVSLPVSEKVKLRFRATPIEDESLFEGLEKKIMGTGGVHKNVSGQAAKKQDTSSSSKTSDTKDTTTSSKTSGVQSVTPPEVVSKEDAESMPVAESSLPPTTTSTEDTEMSSTKPSASTPPSTTTSTKSAEPDSKQEVEDEEMKACRAEIEHALLSSGTGEVPQDSASVKSYEILELLKLINSLLSSPNFEASSFIKPSVLPLQFKFQLDHYKNVSSIFSPSPPIEEKELVALGIKTPHHCIRSKKYAKLLEDRAGTQVALACFIERASRALQLLLGIEEAKSADMEPMRCIVKGINRSATVSLIQALLSSTTFQMMRRVAYSKKLRIDDVSRLRLKASPVGGDGLFGPVLTSIIEDGIKCNRPLTLKRRGRGQGGSFVRSQGQMRTPPKQAGSYGNTRRGGSGMAQAGKGPRRLQGAYAGVKRGKKPQTATRGHHPAAAPTRGTQRGGSRGVSRRGLGGSLSERGLSRAGMKTSRWSSSNRRGSKGFSAGQQHGASDSNIHVVHAGIQAQMRAAQRELVLLHQQAQLTQMQIFEEQGRLSNYQQNTFSQGRSYQDARRSKSRWSGRGNKSSGRPAKRQRTYRQ